MTSDRFQELAKAHHSISQTRIVLTGARSAFIGPSLVKEPYRTAVTSIIVGLDRDITLSWIENSEDPARPSPLAVIPPDTVCELDTDGDIAILFTDVLKDDCSEIDLRLVESNIDQLRELLRQGPGDRAPEAYLQDVFSELGVVSEMSARQEIARVVAALGRTPEEFATVERAAELAGLSTMRFQHVFTETVGVPFRRYRQWRRMGRVIRALAKGDNLTEAAYLAGFSNSAHLSTAFKAMFGLRPSTLLANPVEYFLSDAEFGDDVEISRADPY
ncbi:MAG TPA: AraC family transcriptional regulator [Hyphomonas sp.]|nr:helix-turn-helix transcriptional regulator [Hyphomonas sp.]HPE47861.1 AraC family transcriptional regulator [Hyphomonas sp.]